MSDTDRDRAWRDALALTVSALHRDGAAMALLTDDMDHARAVAVALALAAHTAELLRAGGLDLDDALPRLRGELAVLSLDADRGPQ